MENHKDLYQKFREESLNAKVVPQFDLMRFMDDYKRSVNFYNSYGLNDKSNTGKILAQRNQ